MLVVALLGALLVAVIVSNQARTGRSGNIAALNNTVEAGLRYADYQLTYSADGADWRPIAATEDNPFPYTFGRGQFKLILSYNSQDSGELANFIKIECTARLLGADGRPITTLRRTRIAYKPVLLADYLRFITNKDRSSLPATLGVPTVTQGSIAPGYASSFYGPIRSNSDIKWTRDSTVTGSALKMYLVDEGTFGGFARRDRIQTSGSFILDDGAQVRRWTGAAWSAEANGYASSDGSFDVTLGLGAGISRYVDGVNRSDSNNILRNIRYQAPPSIDITDPTTGQSRYLLLTRDSGDWLQDGSSNWYNTGWYGYGQGIYIDNFADIQEAHNLSALRGRWMTPTPNTYYWDKDGWSYSPPGVEIILHPDVVAASGYSVPVMELVRDDQNWKNSDGSDSGSKSLYLPYPRNGVLFAEGNIRISGVLPPAWGSPGGYYYADDSNRFFDLSVVSNGTVYIEGDIMSPNTYLANGGTISGYSTADESHNTRIALLARDHGCLNLTACGLRYVTDSGASNAIWNGTNGYWNLAPGGSVTWSFRSFQPTVAPRLYIRHGGLLGALGAWDDGGAPPTNYYPSLLRLTVGGTAFDWGGGFTTFSYHPTYSAMLYSTGRTLDQSAPSDWEVSVRTVPETGLANIVATNSGGALNNNVAIAGFQVLPRQINIDALVFAQEGSWFVLPGPWFNASWNYLGSLLVGDSVDDTVTGQTAGIPSYRMALGSIYLTSAPYNRPSIYFNGAITESHTAVLGDAHDWLSKWSGPEALISYTFDGGLRYTPYTDANGNRLIRIPKLPCPPGLIIWGEE